MNYGELGGDPRRLAAFYRNNYDVRAILDHLGSQPKPAMRVSAEDLSGSDLAGSQLKRREVIDAFKALDSLGCGRFRVGRRKWPTRFEFYVSPSELLPIAQSAEFTQPADTSRSATASASTPPRMLGHTFRLRPQVSVTFELPEDIAPKEIVRLTEFLKTVPFE